MDDVRAVAKIHEEALNRMNLGSRKYGEFRAGMDPRDMYREMEEELLDFINYAAMQILNIRKARETFKRADKP